MLFSLVNIENFFNLLFLKSDNVTINLKNDNVTYAGKTSTLKVAEISG